MTISVNETMLMEMIWRELENMRRVRAANEYNSYLASFQYTGPVVDKLFNNTYEYLAALADVEGATPEVVMEQAVRDSLQAHIAHFVEKQPHLHNSFSAKEIAGLKAYAMRKVMVDTLIGSVQDIYVAEAPAPGERSMRSKRSRRRGQGDVAGNETHTSADPHERDTTSRRRRRSPNEYTEPQAPVKRASLRDTITSTGAKPMEPKVQQQVSAPVDNVMKTGEIIKRLSGEKMDYEKHQSVKIFDTAKPAPDRPKNFESQLKMAPIVRPIQIKGEEEETIEVLHSGTDAMQEYDAIPLLENKSPMVLSVTAACLATRSEIRNSNFSSPGRQTGVVEFEVITPLHYFESNTSAQIALNEHYLFPLVDFADQKEYGFVEWHARIEHAREMADCAMATALISQLDRLATVEFNNFLKYTLGLASTIDSFVEDFQDFYAAVSKSMGVEVLDALLGESVDGKRNNDVAGSLLLYRMANVRLLPQEKLSPMIEDNSGVALCLVQPVTVISLGANSTELRFATTSTDYNSITSNYSENEEHVIPGLLRMFSAALQSRKQSSVYLVTNDNEIFHIRDLTRNENNKPVLHLGIKYVTNPFLMGA